MSDYYHYKLRDFYLSKQFFSTKYENIADPLIKSFIPKKGIPLNLKKPRDYYSSTTSTTLLSLHHMRLLSEELRNSFHETLFWLRDNTENTITKPKLEEDKYAWDVSESANVWCTSLALWSLLETNYDGEKNDELIQTSLWLVDQQRTGNGWGFDVQSKSSVFITAITIHALKLALTNLDFSEGDYTRINNGINNGVRFISNSKKEEDDIVYWNINEDTDEADETNTLYALWILKSINESDPNIKKGLNFIKKCWSSKSILEFNNIIEESDTKYRQHKIITSYTPSFPILLLQLGISPYDDVCIKSMNWLKEKKRNLGWNLPGQNEDSLSFTTALALWTISDWHRSLISHTINDVESAPLTVQRLRNRISYLILTIFVLLIAYIITHTNIVGSYLSSVNSIIEQYAPNLQTYESLISIIGIPSIVGLIKIIDNKLGKRLSNWIRTFMDRVSGHIYVE